MVSKELEALMDHIEKELGEPHQRTRPENREERSSEGRQVMTKRTAEDTTVATPRRALYYKFGSLLWVGAVTEMAATISVSKTYSTG
jgi:hypothetical protein